MGLRNSCRVVDSSPPRGQLLKFSATYYYSVQSRTYPVVSKAFSLNGG
jgi:hypothetical protein